MHNHTKQQLENFEDSLPGILTAVLYSDNNPPGSKKDDWVFLYKDNNNISVWFNKTRLKNFLKQALLSQAEMIRDEMVLDANIKLSSATIRYIESDDKAGIAWATRHEKIDVQDEIKAKLDELINSFE